jgi:alpha-tubulin suppressor-like RCC1 family protein
MRIQEIGFGGGYLGSGTFENTSIAMFLDNGTTSRIVTCGDNEWGQLGDTTTTDKSTPVIPTGVNFRVAKMVWAGAAPGSCWILGTNGALWNWGYNAYGQLDRGNTTQNILLPAQVETGIIDLHLHNHSWAGFPYINASPIVQKADGYYRCGYNGDGQLGDGTTTNRTTLVKMRFPEGITFKMFGAMGAQTNEQQTFYGVDTENRLWAWGENSAYGITSVGTGGVMAQPVQITPPAMIR